MSAWLNAKVQQVCPRCGAPSSETSVLCEPHRIQAAARQSRYAAKHRPARRSDQRCAFCQEPSATYRCARCKAKYLRWAAGLSPGSGDQRDLQEHDQVPVITKDCADQGARTGELGSAAVNTDSRSGRDR